MTEDGAHLREQVLGTEHVIHTSASPLSATAEFVALAEELVWSRTWGREGLERAEQSTITIATLAALGHAHELRLHICGAIRNGILDADHIGRILLHQLPYVGFPIASHALGVLRAVVEESVAAEAEERSEQ
ncbi:MAG: 4-carboxymuconolactone decarboxylase [Micromonosporaceae bacterium]|nr:4-carboxymuconolactone decarboxylase [Micromonosporaceae bacterium]